MKAAVLAAALLAATAVQAAEPITLKVHHFWPPGAMPPTQILAPWCERIAADSGQRLKCQIYPAMQLGGTPAQLIDQVKDGVVDIAFTLPGYTAGRFPVMEVFELPFMTNSAEAASRRSPNRRASSPWPFSATPSLLSPSSEPIMGASLAIS